MKTTHQKTNSVLPATSDMQNFEQMPAFSGVSQTEFKKQEAELRKKKEEAFALQIEVKELSEKIGEMQRDNADKVEEIKTEFEIKIMELEAKLSDNSLLQTVETQHKEEKAKWDTILIDLRSSLDSQIQQLKSERDQAIAQALEHSKRL